MNGAEQACRDVLAALVFEEMVKVPFRESGGVHEKVKEARILISSRPC